MSADIFVPLNDVLFVFLTVFSSCLSFWPSFIPP